MTTPFTEAKKAFERNKTYKTAKAYFETAVEFDRCTAVFSDSAICKSRDATYRATLVDLVAFAHSIGMSFSVEWDDFEKAYLAVLPSFMERTLENSDDIDDTKHDNVEDAVTYIREIFGDVDIKIVT